MKNLNKRKIFLMLISLNVFVIASVWCYFVYLPQMKMEQIKAEAQEVVEVDSTPYTYFDYLKEKEKEQLTYLVLGDSVAKGQKVHSENFAQIVKSNLEHRVEKKVFIENLAIPKLTSNELVEKIKEPETRDKIKEADLISLNIGGNDLVQIVLNEGIFQTVKKYPTIKDEYENNINEILREIYLTNDNVVVLINELYNVVGPEESFYSASKRLLIDWNLVIYENSHIYSLTLVVPLSDTLSPDKKNVWLADEVHPNDYGHQLMAGAIIDLLSNNYSDKIFTDR